MRHGTVVTLEDQISFASDRLVINPRCGTRPTPAPSVRARREASCLPDEEDSYLTGKIGFRLKASEAPHRQGELRPLRSPAGLRRAVRNSGSVQGKPRAHAGARAGLDLGSPPFPPPAAGRPALGPLEFTLFETLAEDLIQFIPNSQSTVLAQNSTGRAIRGAELNAALGIGKPLQRQPERHPPAPRDVSGRPTTGVFCRDDRKNEMTASATLAPALAACSTTSPTSGAISSTASNTPSEALPPLPARCRLRCVCARASMRPSRSRTGRRKDLRYVAIPAGRATTRRMSWEF